MTKPVSKLMQKARRAAKRAYAPYSRFRVGAAVECADGTVVIGVNVENASYGLTVCAERTAMLAAIARGKTGFKRIAVSCEAGPGSSPEERAPCGQCRQVMAEFMASDSIVEIDGVGNYPLSKLLPLPFRLDASQEPKAPSF